MQLLRASPALYNIDILNMSNNNNVIAIAAVTKGRPTRISDVILRIRIACSRRESGEKWN